MMHQVPWDPGGSTWHRLEVKPEFKEGGMLAISPIAPTMLGLGCHYWAWATGRDGGRDYKYRQEAIRTGWFGNWNGMVSASFALCLLLPHVFLFLPLMARTC
jgi:hypothetical protein